MKIVPFRNRSGSRSWRLTGTLPDGRRIRRNFHSRPEAESALEDLLRTFRGHDGRRRAPRLTWLSADELRDAELAAELLGPVSLVEAARHYAGTHARVQGIPLRQAARQYAADRRAAGVRERTIENVDYTLAHWFAGLRAHDTAAITLRDVRAYVLAADRSQRTRSDRRQILGQFCRWCVQHGAMAQDLTQAIPQVRVERDLPRILSIDEARGMLQAAQAVDGGRMLGYVVLCLFTGLRPTEARRLAEEDIHLDPALSCIQVSPRIAKVRQARTIELSPPVRAILAAQPPPRVAYVRYAFDAIRQRAGMLGRWQADIMRHSYASYHYAAHRDIAALTYQMGNSEQVLFRSYIRPVTRREADAYWALLAHYL